MTSQATPPAPEDLARVRKLPIVDAHVHTFNARYLPLEHIVLGKRDIHVLASFVGDRFARRLARGLTRFTKLTHGLPKTEPSEPFLKSETLSDDEREFFERLQEFCDRCNAKGDPGSLLLTEQDEDVIEELRRILGPVLGMLLNSKIARQFLVRLVTEDGKMEALFQYAYRNRGSDENRIELLVSHIGDMAAAYAQIEPGRTGMLDPRTDQFWRMAKHQAEPNSRMIWFAGYSPFRPVGPGEDHLAPIKDAIRNHGAYGIKVYPPDGYRASHNEIPDRPVTLFTDFPEKWWDFRYEVEEEHTDSCHNDARGRSARELDERILELAAYCEKRGIPIFVHSGHGEFEARKGYGACMAHPVYWYPVLKAHPNLRLCFAHAGGQEFWFDFDDEGYMEWGARVAQLCLEFPNVYADVGVHDGFARKKKHDPLRSFVRRIAGLIKHPDARHRIEKKLIYGSDWFMPRSTADERSILDGFQEAFAHRELVRYAPRFFSENALDYLDLAHRISLTGNEDQARLPAKLRMRLKTSLKRIADGNAKFRRN